MKSILKLFVLFLLLGCNNNESNDDNSLIRHLEITDATELFVSCEKQSPGLSNGKYSLCKIRSDGSIAKVPIMTVDGKNLDCVFAVIGNYNSKSIFLRIGHYNAANEIIYIIDKQTGNATKAPDKMVFIGNASNDLYSGSTYSYNDEDDNFYYYGIESTVAKYTPNLLVENLTAGYDVDNGREFAVDNNADLVIQIYNENWLYRSNDNLYHIFKLPYAKYNSYEDKSRVFGLKNKPGFFFIADNTLHHIEYDHLLKDMRTTEKSRIDYSYSDFRGIYYYSNKTILTTHKGAMIMDANYNIYTIQFTNIDHYGNYFHKARNSFIWFYDSYTKAKKFNLETQTEENIYNIDGYLIDGVNIEPDESITIYGLKMSIGKKVIANIKNGSVVSETEWTSQPYVENSHWLKLYE